MTAAQRNLIIVLIVLAVLLTAALGVGYAINLRETERLRDEQSRLEDRTPLGEITTPAPIVGTNGYRLLADGKSYGLGTFYFGDETLYGRGMTEIEGSTNYNLPSWRKMLTDELRAAYGGGLGGTVITLVQTNTLTLAAEVFARNATLNGPDMLAVLAPSDATAKAGAAAHGEGYSFAAELEGCLRKMREASPHCDILLAVPYNASAEVAEAILALAGHYSLRAVDLRTLLAEDGLVHPDGPHAGYPTEAGHVAMAAALKAEIDAAALLRYTSPEIGEPLYQGQEN
jgi:hypothetical protein